MKISLPYLPKSKSNVHLTPIDIKKKVKELWGINWDKAFDPCPVDPKFDGLHIKWKSVNVVNPPYEDDLKRPTALSRFVDKALLELKWYKHTSIMLLPSKTDQDWYQYLWDNGFISPLNAYFVPYRIKFANDKDSSMQAHFLVRIAPK